MLKINYAPKAFFWSRLPPKFDIYTLLCHQLLFMYQG